MFLLQRSTHATDWTWTSSTAYSHLLCTAKHLWAPVLWAKMTVVRARTQFSQLSIETQEAGRCLWEILPAVVWTAAGGCWRLLKAVWHGVLSISKQQCPTASAGICPSVLTTPIVNTFFTLYLLEFSLLQGDLVASCSFTLYHSETFVSAFSNNAPLDRWRQLLDLFFSKAKKSSSFRLSPVHQRNAYATDSV